MEALVLYLGKTALAMGAFFLAYLLLFQNRKQFQFNRVYLLASMAFSFLIPLVTFTVIREIPLSLINSPSEAGITPASVSTFEIASFRWEWYHFLLLLYASGILGGVIYLVAGHIKAMSIIRRSKRLTLCETEIHLSADEIHPFSFFTRIVVPESALSHPDLPLIIDHERIHVAENHTIDILLAEILFLFQWFNPFAWLMRDAVKNNLEYKTDHVVVKSCDPKTYQLAMVSLADKKGVAPFLTAFNGSQLKNRIIMMKMKTENKNTWTRQLVLIPLLALLVTGLSGRNIKYEILQEEVVNVNPGKLEQEAEKKVVVRKGADASGKLITDTTITIKGKPLYIVDGKEYTGNPDNIKPDEISSITVLKDQASLSIYGEKGKNGVVLINTKTKYNSDQVIITRKDSASSSDPVFFIVEEMPEFPGGEAALREFIAKTIQYPPSALEKEIMGKVYVTFVVSKEGKVTKAKIARGVHPDLDKEALRVVNVLPTWKPGMQRGKPVDVSYTVPVTFGIQGKTNSPDMFSMKGDKKPLIVLDGNITEKNISDINPNEIAAISVLKGENAIQKYGDKAKDGAIEITMKDLSIRITSNADFRNFIAKNITYPLEAQKSNTEGTVSLWLKLDENGKILQVLREAVPGDYLSFYEVVVVAYKTKPEPAAPGDEVSVVGYGSKSDQTSRGDKPLVIEAGRVINMIPAIDIPEMKGKVVKVTVKFMLQ